MIYAIVIVLVLVLIYGPQLWVQWILNRYNQQPEDNFPGTGGGLARHPLDRSAFQAIKGRIIVHSDHLDTMSGGGMASIHH